MTKIVVQLWGVCFIACLSREGACVCVCLSMENDHFQQVQGAYVYPGGGYFSVCLWGGPHVLLEDTLQLLYSKDTNDNQLVHNMTQSLVSHLHVRALHVCVAFTKYLNAHTFLYLATMLEFLYGVGQSQPWKVFEDHTPYFGVWFKIEGMVLNKNSWGWH